MNNDIQCELEAAIKSDLPLDGIVTLLRRYKQQGITQREVYAFLEKLHHAAPDDATDDRILEVSDFVAGSCAPHMKVWDSEASAREPMQRRDNP